MTTPTDGDDPTRRDPGTAEGARPAATEPPARPAQASGKQFERGTESGHEPGSETDAEAEAEDAGLGPGASASGKRFARGTDSDGDGVGYEAPGD